MTATSSSTPALREGPNAIPLDASAWVDRETLLLTVRLAAARAGGNGSWLNLVTEDEPARPADDLLVLVAYCYAQGIFHSIDVVRRLESDELLDDLRSRLATRPEAVRRLRRERRRSLTDCLTHTFVTLWRRRQADRTAGAVAGAASRQGPVDFRFLEPFYLQAQDRIDRAVVLDSMASDV